MTEFVNRRQPDDPVGDLRPHNQLIDAVNRANSLSVVYPLELHKTAAGVQLRLAQREFLKHVTLAENVAPSDTDKMANVLDYDASNTRFVDTTLDSSFTDQTIDAVTDPHDGGLYLKHERHVCYFDPENTKYLPVSGPTWHLGIADSAIPAGGSGTVSIWKVDIDDDDSDLNTTEHVDSTLDVTAYDLFGTGLPAGDELVVFFHGQSRRWYAMRAGATTMIRFETTATKTFAENVTGEKLDWNGNAYATDGTTIGLVDYLGAFGPVDSGTRGWAIRMPDYSKVTIDSAEYDAYEIVYMDGKARWVSGTLTEDMGATAGDEASATATDYWGDPGHGLAAPVGAGAITVLDPQQLFTRAKDGAEFLAVLNERSDQYHLIRCETQAKVIVFTLTEGMGDTTANQASCTLNDYYHGQNPGATGTVSDPQQLFTRALSGAKGKAVYDDRSNEYHIVECRVEVTAYIGKLVGALTTSDSTKGVDDLEAMGEGQTRRVDATTSITANNIFSGEGDDNGQVLIRYNQKDDDWDIITGACPA